LASNASTTTKKSTAKARTTRQAKAADRNVDSAVAYVRQTAERAVDVPVGAALVLAESVKPLTDETTRERELRTLRTQLNRELNKFERRGGQARRKLRTRARTQRARVERELRQRRNRLERTVKQNRTKAERTVKQNRTKLEKVVRENRVRAEKALRDAQSTVTERVGTLSS
jgi:hypothetical protein